MEEIAFKIDINVNIRDYVRIWEVRSAEEPPVVCVKIAFGADGALFVHVRAGTTLVCIKRLSPEFLMFFNDRRPPGDL